MKLTRNNISVFINNFYANNDNENHIRIL